MDRFDATGEAIHPEDPVIKAVLVPDAGIRLRYSMTKREVGKPCLDLCTLNHSVRRLVEEAKQAPIHDPVDRLLFLSQGHDRDEV